MRPSARLALAVLARFAGCSVGLPDPDETREPGERDGASDHLVGGR